MCSSDLPADCGTWLEFGLALEFTGETEQAMAAYREALRQCPDLHPARARLGGLIAATGDLEGGGRLLDEVLNSDPGLTDSVAEAMNKAGLRRRSAGDAKGAIALLRRAQGLSPANLKHGAALGEALEDAGDRGGALAEYRAVVAGAPESPHCCERIDVIYQGRKDGPGRLAEWRRIVEMHPDAAWPRLHLGLALEDSGDLEGAKAAYREALSHNARVEIDSGLFRSISESETGLP